LNPLSAMYLSTEQLNSSIHHQKPLSCSVETIMEQGSADLNEDVLLQDGNMLGVFDGATSLYDDNLPAGVTGGLLAAQIAAESFRSGAGSLVDRAQAANTRIGAKQQSLTAEKRGNSRLWSTSAAVVQIEDGYFDYCQTGDSLIIAVRDDGSFSLLTPDSAHDCETLSLWKDADVPAGVTIHELLSEQIRAVRATMNISYGSLNGEPEAMHFLRHGRESLDGVRALLLFTDGLFLPKEDPHQHTDWSRLVDLFHEGGLHAIHDRVRAQERTDPGCRRYPRFKMHDDIAAIAVTF